MNDLKEKRGILSEQPPGPSAAGRIFPGKKSDYQCAFRSGAGGRGQRKERFPDHRGLCALEQGKDVWAVPGRLAR